MESWTSKPVQSPAGPKLQEDLLKQLAKADVPTSASESSASIASDISDPDTFDGALSPSSSNMPSPVVPSVVPLSDETEAFSRPPILPRTVMLHHLANNFNASTIEATYRFQPANQDPDIYVEVYTKGFFLSLLAWGAVQGSGLLLCLMLFLLPAGVQTYVAHVVTKVVTDEAKAKDVVVDYTDLRMDTACAAATEREIH